MTAVVKRRDEAAVNVRNQLKGALLQPSLSSLYYLALDRLWSQWAEQHMLRSPRARGGMTELSVMSERAVTVFVVVVVLMSEKERED